MSAPRRSTLQSAALALAIVAGPALFFADNLLHPDELALGNEREQLAIIRENLSSWQAAHLIGFLSFIPSGVVLLGLAFMLHERRPRAAVAGAVLTLAGLLGIAFAFAVDGYAWGVLGDLSSGSRQDAATLETAMGELRESPWGVPYFALAGSWLIGFLVLLWAARASGFMPPALAAILALAALLVSLQGSVFHGRGYYLSSAAVLLVAAGAAAVHYARSDTLWTWRRPART